MMGSRFRESCRIDPRKLPIGVDPAFADTDPPPVVNQAGLAVSAIRFDPTYGSPLGRVFQAHLGKRF